MFEGSSNQCRYDDVQDTIKDQEKGSAVGLLEVSRTLYGVEDTDPSDRHHIDPSERCHIDPEERCHLDPEETCPVEQIATHVKCEVVQWACGIGHGKEGEQQQDLVHMERGVGAFEETRIGSNGKSRYYFKTSKSIVKSLTPF